ncbi:MAG: hypothetical protein M1818_005017 [Claussenomyces sp. TS43310]|nr:MAG: hypothetical protein M1818_005017 [Claussenomyces sp. TS43310]
MLNPREIRLLHIEPGISAQIKCRVSTVPLDSSLAYDALSYTWGGQELSHEITVSGQTCSVTLNLHDALQHLRYEDVERRIWIDAICINQYDDNERACQVRIMADIFRCARQVVMWVGKETEFDGMAFALFKQLREVFKTFGRVDFDFQQVGPDDRTSPGYGLPETGADDWIALIRLFQRPYFTRTWVIQEVVMASNALLACGHFEVEWELLRDFARSVLKGGAIGELEFSENAPGIRSINVMADLKAGSGTDLLSLLTRTRAYEATVAVDKVFGLLNLVSNPHDVGVEIDYSQNAPGVWKKLAVHSLTVHKSLLSLSNAGTDASSGRSWIPDWSNTNGNRGCLALYGKDHFRASGDTKTSAKISDDLQTLTVTGFIVDAIAIVAPPGLKFARRVRSSGSLIWQTPEEEQARFFEIATELRGARAAAASAFQYTEGVSRERELARTFCCDMLTTGEAADIDGANETLKWMMQAFDLFPPPPGTDIEAMVREIQLLRPPGIMIEQFMHSATMFGVGRSVCATTGGDIGRVPFGTQAGDLVCVLQGGIVPCLLRLENDCYKLVGECYMNGIMHGQALERQDLVEQEFDII